MATTIFVGATMLSTAAFAQDQAPSPAAGPIEGQPASVVTPGGTEMGPNQGGDIVVTGSRIPQPNLTSASPVTVLNSEQVKLTGTTRVEDLINQLPQAFGSQGGGVSNGSSGTATINLRNLGEARTLVLINGRRLVPGDPQSPFADINFIPGALIKRIDVLTGGASSVYGADAVAGVVNFVMDTDYSGFKIDSQYSFYQHDNDTNQKGIIDALNRRGFGYPRGNSANGGQIEVTATFGAGFDDGRGHVTAYVGYRKINSVTQDSRDYSACALTAATPGVIAAGGIPTSCGGSATSANFQYVRPGAAGLSLNQLGAGRTFATGSNVFNFAPTNYYQRPDERFTGGFFGHYDVDDAFKPYVEGMFMDDRTVAQIAPSGNFGNTTTINCDNPLLGAQQQAQLCSASNLVNSDGLPIALGGGTPATFIDPTTGTSYQRGFLIPLRRNIEGGPRRDDLQHTSYRGVIGAKGDIAKGVSYDTYYQYGRTNFSETYFNDFSISRLGNALDVVTGPGGTPICRSVRSGADVNCVPYDIFVNGGVNTAALGYLQTPGFQRGTTSEQVFNASVTALLGEYGIQSPWSNDGVAVNVGYEYRKERLELFTDSAFQTGDLAGQGAATLPVSGAFSVREAFTEVQVPIVHDGFFYDLSVTGGYRFSNYKINQNNTNTHTYKGEVRFAPVRDITLRGAYNRAVRSPNIQELFAPTRVVLNGSSDPCVGDLDPTTDTPPPTATQAQCALTGVTAAQYGNLTPNPAGQYNGLIGGNVNLSPEKADTFTVGAVLQPTFLPRFSLTVDAFQIKVKNTISTIGQDTTIQQCLDTGNPVFCNLINRDAIGSLWLTPGGFITDTNQNLGSLKTRGIDVGASYSYPVGNIGSFSLSMQGTYLDELEVNNGTSTPYDCAGLYGLQCGTPSPKWRHRARLGFNAENGLGLSFQWRYFDPVKLDRTSANPTLTGPFSPVNRRIGSQSYFDLTATARVSDRYTFRLGVNNLLDREPPLIGANGADGVTNAGTPVLSSGNTFPTVYDALGRYIFAGVTLDF